MTKVSILITGYVRGTKVVPTTTLIQDGRVNIVVDPGMGQNKEKFLKKALQKEGLKFKDIKIVFCTHYHLDHTQNVGLFPKATLIDYQYTYRGNDWTDHKGDGYKISPHVKILHTPGHTPEHASLVVKTDQGIIVVAGDVWWHSDFTPQRDPMASDQKTLNRSRKKVLASADLIIPGHGGLVKNRRK